MSLIIDTSNEKIFRRRLTSLNTSTKISNTNKSNGSIKTRGSQIIQNNSRIILPSINSSITRAKRKTILEPESLMSKFLGNYKPNYSDKIKEESANTKPPKLKSRNSRNSIMIKSKSLNNILIPIRKETKFKSQRIFITEKDRNKINLLKSKIKNNYSNLLDKIEENIFEEKKINFDNNKGEEITNIKSIKTISENDNNEDSLVNDKELYIFNNNIRRTQRKQNTNSSSIMTKDINNKKSDKNLKNISIVTNSNNSSLISNNFSTSYKRLRKFTNPFSKEESDESKEKSNINTSQITKEENLVGQLYENNIKFQSKILDEQVRLFNGCYKEYKLIYLHINFIEVFKSKTLFYKIKYNKIIEETCSILFYFPKFFLKEWHDLMLSLEKIKIPSKKNFISDYIMDENITVKNNNYLLTEVTNYFNKSFDFYLMLSKKESEVADVKFTQKTFYKIIKYIKTARYNIIYLINSFNNSKKKILEDLTIIKKFLIRNNNLNIINNIKAKEDEASFSKKIFKNVLLLENEKSKNLDIIEKIEEQFYFKRDDEAQKKRQIESALDIDKRKEIYNHLGKIVVKKRKLYKSIFWNKHMNKVLNYCYDNVRDQINTEKVNDQEKKVEIIKKKNINPIKFNFN